MSSGNRIKTYVENGIYHVYNRGVNKQEIYLDDQDYRVFLHLLKYYLSPVSRETRHPLDGIATILRPRPLANLADELDLIAFCLMPNHFHLLIKQFTVEAMTKLMRRVLTTYVMYFNRRYKRVGYLFQGRYKAVLVETEEYLLHLSRYIHLNPVESVTRTDLVTYPYSSYPFYLGLKSATWVKTEEVLSLMGKQKYASYKDFVESHIGDDKEFLGKLMLED